MAKEEVVKPLRDTLLNIALSSIMTYLKVQFPFFNLPIIRNITELIISKILSIAFDETELGIYILMIRHTTSKEAQRFEIAVFKHKEAILRGTDEDKEKAREELLSAFRDLVKFGNH